MDLEDRIIVAENVEVDGFEIDIEALADANSHNSRMVCEAANCLVTSTVIANLTPESKKRFEEYQEQNNPCR